MGWRSWCNYVWYGLLTYWARAMHWLSGAKERVSHIHRRDLAVLIHGLSGHPADMDPQRQLFVGTHAVYVPWVLQGGNCSVEEAAKPIRAVIDLHLARHPDARVVLIGLSNGGRIAARLECDLRERGAPVFLSGMATPFGGSPLMEKYGWLPVAVGRYSEKAVKDLTPGSIASRLLEYDIIYKARPKESRTSWYAAADDWMVPIESARPAKIHSFYVFENHCHVSLVHAVAAHQYKAVLDWIIQLSKK